jgi:hypothetical protein
MYLPLLSTSRESLPTVTHGKSMYSTGVPLTRRANGAQMDGDVTRSRKDMALPTKVQWEPVAFKDIVVYVRRLVAL